MVGERSTYTGRQIEEVLDDRYELFDADDDKVADILEIGPDYVIAKRDGGLFGEDRIFYVPRREIAREDGTEWYLSIDKDQLDDMDWSQPPSDGVSAGTGTATQGLEAGDRVEDGGVRVVRYEEELQVEKTTQQAGEAVVRKDVVEEVQTIDVPVRREELRIERRPASGDTEPASETAFSGESITVPLMEEQVQVQKVVRPVEEIEVGKVVTEETRQVQETVRKERVDIDDVQGNELGTDQRRDD